MYMYVLSLLTWFQIHYAQALGTVMASKHCIPSFRSILTTRNMEETVPLDNTHPSSKEQRCKMEERKVGGGKRLTK